MKHKENIQTICNSLTSMGLQEVGETIFNEFRANQKEDPLALVVLTIKSAAVEKSEALASRLIKRSKLGKPCYLEDLLDLDERQIDYELIEELGELHFIKDNRNLVIWGAPGTGKTWFAKALATNSCKAGIRTRWVTFPILYRELKRLKEKDSRSLESRFQYYCKFPLLCIDEFPNIEIEDNYIIQEFFDIRSEKKVSTIVCSQSNPERWEHLFPITSFGESIKGRVLQNALRLELKGPDLRLINLNN
jgi:DNA replication protein DnaC